MTLQGFSFGSAAEVLDDYACEENDGIEEGFGFGDGYNFGAAARRKVIHSKGISDEAVSGVAVEADAVEVV